MKNKVMKMKEININGLRIQYERDRDLFNRLLKMNEVSKKRFCEKFDLSYSYVNAWGSTTKEKEIKFPSWVFVYLRDVMYFKIEAIKIKMSLEMIYDALESGQNLTEMFVTLHKKRDNNDNAILIPDEFIEKENRRVLRVSSK